MSRKFKKVFLLLIAFAIIVLVYAHFETYWIQIIPTTVSSRELPTEFSEKKIAFIADMHCGENFDPARLEKIVRRINQLKPDIMLFGGDYVDRNGKNTDTCFKKLAGIETPLGKFGILGNHDPEVGRERIKEAMIAAGITPLVNENRKIIVGESEITIAGTDETWYGNPDGAKTMENASDFTVYLSHDPRYLEQYRPDSQLLLSGHTHGGQVTLFGISFAWLVHGKIYKYEKGIFKETGRTVIITNGTGATVLPLRFFARPQINLITLKN